MAIKFDVKMTAKIMYDFSLYTTYTSFNGIAGIVLGGAGLFRTIQYMTAGNITGATPYLLIAIFFLIGSPVAMWLRSAEQVLKTPMFQKPITYEFTEEGVLVSQDGESVLNEWGNFQKAVSTNRSIILYVTKVRAIILPKKEMGEQYQGALQMICTHMDSRRVKIRQ